jgi:hypothetical protein
VALEERDFDSLWVAEHSHIPVSRRFRYREAPTSEWTDKLRAAGLPEHVVYHLTVMTELQKQGRYDRMSEDYLKLTGERPTSMAEFVKLHAAEFTRL